MPAPLSASRRRGQARRRAWYAPLLLVISCLPFLALAADQAEGTPTPVDIRFDAQSLMLHIDHPAGRWTLRLDAKELVHDASDWQSALLGLPRFFDGQVIDDPQSWARISIEDGEAPRYSGHVFVDDELHELQYQDALGGQVLVHMPAGLALNDMIMPDAPTPDDSNASAVRVRTATSDATSDETPVTSRAIRIGIAVDSAYNEHHDGRGLAHALTLINGVDGLYQSQLGLALVVDGYTLYDDPEQDPLRDHLGDVDQVLSQYREIRLQDPNLPTDLALVHLFSGHPDPDRVIGLGWIDTLCRLDGYDVSLSTPFPYDMLLAAHEIAHNLGAEHDDSAACSSDESVSDNHIMWSEISGATQPNFSGCSLNRIRPAMASACVLDNIDVAIALSAEAQPSPNRLAVTVAAFNNDFARHAPSLRSQTRFPAGTRLLQPPAGCRVEAETLICQHETLLPGGQSLLSVIAEFPNHGATDPQVHSEILPSGFVDTRRGDNVTSLRLDDAAHGLDSVTFADAADAGSADTPTDEDTTVAEAANPANETVTGGSAGVGGLGPTGLLVLSLLTGWGLIRRGQSARGNGCQYVRSIA